MAQPSTSDLNNISLEDGVKNHYTSSTIFDSEELVPFLTSCPQQHCVQQAVEGHATGSLHLSRQRPEGLTQPPHRSQHHQRLRHLKSAVAEKPFTPERKQTHASCSGSRKIICIRVGGAVVRNRKRRWGLLAEHGMLRGFFERARRRNERHCLPGVVNLSQRQACVGANDDKKPCCAWNHQENSPSHYDAHLYRQSSAPEPAPSSSAASGLVHGPRGSPSPPSLSTSQDCASSDLLCTAATNACNAGGLRSPTSSLCRTEASVKTSVSKYTSPASSARDPYRLLNPPSFAALGVPPALIRVAASLHIERPSPIQILTLPRALQGGDLCGVAPTGTGKTLCYCWPLLQRIARGHGHAFLGLVLLPARELAVQVLEQFRIYGASLGTRVGVLLGGRDLTEEGNMLLQQAPHILIATPGRLADNVQNNSITMRQRLSVVEVLVLDEADMLLSDDFKEDLKCILSCLPPSSAAASGACSSARNSENPTHMNSASPKTIPGKNAGMSVRSAAPPDPVEPLCEEKNHKPRASSLRVASPSSSGSVQAHGTASGIIIPGYRRQTLLFSATVSPALLALQQQRFGDTLMPLFDATAAATQVCQLNETSCSELAESGVQDDSTQHQVLLPRLSHYYLFVPTAMRFAYLLYLLEHVPPFNRDRGIIFAGSVRQTQRLCTALEVLQQQVTSLHSLMKQRTRIACLEKFRSEVARLLICTDVAGRGLDLPRVEFVICLDVPSKPQVYIHRTGRTARAGRKGVALTFVDPSSVRAVHRVEACIHKRLEPLPSFDEKEVLQRLNHYSRVLQRAALFLNEIGFDDKAEQHEAYSKAFKELRRRTRDAKPLPV